MLALEEKHMNWVKKMLNILFLFTMLLYVLLGVIVVVIQAGSIVFQDGGLCLWARDTFLAPACVLCGCTSLISFAMSYIYDWKMKD